jgi:cell division protein FtsZ
MVDDIMEFNMDTSYEPIIKIIGVGGGGSNAVEYMYNKGISDVEFIVCNTDAMALEACSVPSKIQLGITLSQGNGAGNNPMNGEQAAIENLDDVIDELSGNTRMIFLTAGMGGGTGTGATPVIAKAAKAKGILTVAIVTIPFRFEGPQRITQAVEGISRLSEYVDSLLVIDNEKLKMIYGDLGLSNAFAKADDIVANAARGIAELITLPGYVNVDFEDVKTVMSDSGVAVMGAAKSQGEDRAIDAIKLALESPLLDNNHITGAKEILLNIVSGEEDDEITMDEVTAITDHVLEQVGGEAQVIWGVGTNPDLNENISVTIVATGFEAKSIEEIIDAPYVKNIQRPKTLITQEINIEAKEEVSENKAKESDIEDKPKENTEIQSEEQFEIGKSEFSETDVEHDEENLIFNIDTKDEVDNDSVLNTEDESVIEDRGVDSNSDVNKYEDDCKHEEEIQSEIIEDKIIEIKDVNNFEREKSKISDNAEIPNSEKKIEYKEKTNVSIEKSIVSEEISASQKEPVIDNQRISDDIKKPVQIKKSIEKSFGKSRVAGEVYYGEVVMKPEMSESMIRKIENVPAYKRRKAID